MKNFNIRKMDEKYVLNWLGFQIFQHYTYENFVKLWLWYEN
jgi:hypothetical protein